MTQRKKTLGKKVNRLTIFLFVICYIIVITIIFLFYTSPDLPAAINNL